MNPAKYLLVIGMLLGGVSKTAPANAGLLNVTYTDSSFSATWQQDSNPVPISYAIGLSTDIPISNATGDLAAIGIVSTDVTYYNSGGFGAIFSGPQIYSGSEAVPEFSVGSFTGLEYPGHTTGGVLTFSLAPGSPAAGPTPGAGLAGLAALALGGLCARTRRA